MNEKTDAISIIEIDINVQSDLWPAALHGSIKEAARQALLEGGIANDIEVSVMLADDVFMRNLNKTYRGKDKATNVLSFPQDDLPLNGVLSLGDIVLAYETIEKEAKAQEKTFIHHTLHLVIHGVLHLLGYDHEKKTEALEMEALEIHVLKSMGIKNPYEDGNFMQ